IKFLAQSKSSRREPSSMPTENSADERRAHCYGFRSRPSNRITPLVVSRMKNAKGWSAQKMVCCCGLIANIRSFTPVAAAASVPSSDTSTKALCTTSPRNRSRLPSMPEKSAVLPKASAMPMRDSMSRRFVDAAVGRLPIGRSLPSCPTTRGRTCETQFQSSLHAPPHRAHRLRQVDPAHVVVVERHRLVVARPLQAALRVGDFHPDGHSGLVPPARLRQLVLRQFQPFLADLYLLLRRAQRVQRQPHIQLDLLLEIVGLHFLRAVLRRRFRPPRISPPAIEQRHPYRDPDGPGRQGIVESRAA